MSDATDNPLDPILWPDLRGRRVLLGVTGGIAGYKAAHLCRLLRRAGAEVQVVMTEAACRFVAPLTFSALSDREVGTDLFDPAAEARIGHIGFADWAELLIVAPATANTLGKLALGLCDNLLSTLYLAFRGPVLLAPAMNVHMWQNPAVIQNIQILEKRGNIRVGPGTGEMACGHVGEGRMAEPELILQAAGACLSRKDLAGRRLLISAGGTREPLDPVRFLGNRSSGKMGFALAAEAACRGGEITLVSGPSGLPTPYGVLRVDVTTAAQMAEAVLGRAGGCEAVIMAAAVADFRPAEPAATKIKKEEAGQALTLVLHRTTDILSALGQLPLPRPLLVGFAAETSDDLDRLARDKLARKHCDLLVANDVRASDAGFDADTNRVVIFDRLGGREALPVAGKRQVARGILDRVAAALNAD